jgi:hypothetical protein
VQPNATSGGSQMDHVGISNQEKLVAIVTMGKMPA